MNRVYKPSPKAYMTVCDVLDVDPVDVLMVTANKAFGDIEASTKLGMKAQLIRDTGGLPDIRALADSLGC